MRPVGFGCHGVRRAAERPPVHRSANIGRAVWRGQRNGRAGGNANPRAVLSPEIVSEDDNTAPSIGEFSGETGLPLVKAPWLLISK